MTNLEIMYNEIISNNLMKEEELKEYLEQHMTLPLYLTFVEWQRKGYKIKKGEKAAIKTKLWMRTRRKIDKTKELDEENSQEYFILVNANLFGENQVERV